ncbi:hypothetical protein GUITHDRAFT_96904 [Guillardia theta CCMP2712]|uniref:RNA polymerase II-associated protein 3 n=1 Tax=Guillardia theta (strain CCMP2712) TaxID=905079 RepID=L1IS22_GUITC|nr:hypothetical protein GUITHDRAFT_96904 [Guillardia theta CCMP2712]EKX38699.1 hypothetical protein GUITHDRAFT_96904 [Guillardia theta CCMP2712]|eukprot:XP_005825679.1 hypothetical protein GUITHDRAFT_96904 [Guillardia theta CCMP2712]
MQRMREGSTLSAESVETFSDEGVEVEVEVPKQGKEGDHVTVSLSFPELGAVKLDAVVPPGKKGGEKFRLKLGRREEIAEKKKLEGIKAFKGGRMQKACEDFSSAILLNPKDPASFLNRSAANFNLGRLEGSLDDAESYLRLLPRCPRGLHRKGLALAALGEFEKAAAALEEALQLAPDEDVRKDLEETKENAEKKKKGEAVSYERVVPDARKESRFLHHRIAAEVEEELQAQWKRSERRRKERESREMERSAAISNEKLAAELARAKEEEEHKKDTERAKFQAVAQRVEFEQFEQNVKGASLKPQRTKTDGKEHGIILTPGSSAAVPGLAKKCFNAMAEGGERRNWLSGGEDATKSVAVPASSSHRPSASSDSPPSNGREFLRRWKSLKGKEDERKQLLLSLPPNPFPCLFKTEMDADLIAEIIALLRTTGLEAKVGLSLLESIGQTQRFSLISRFLSKRDKEEVKKLLDEYQTQQDLPQATISSLRNLFA